MIERHKCFLCGSSLDNAVVVWQKLDDGDYVHIRDADGKNYHTVSVICGCGLIQVLDPMRPLVLDNFYSKPEVGESPYRQLFKHQKEASLFHIQNFIGFMTTVYKNNNLIKPNTYLDFGGASIDTLGLVQKHLNIQDVYLYDPGVKDDNPYVLKDLQDKKFDLISILGTLEHMHNPIETLDLLNDYLSDEGLIMISVPDIMTQMLTVPKDAWFSAAHLYHFDITSLLRVITKAGYIPVYSTQLIEEVGEKLYLVIKKSPTELDWRQVGVSPDENTKRLLINFIHASNEAFDYKRRLIDYANKQIRESNKTQK